MGRRPAKRPAGRPLIGINIGGSPSSARSQPKRRRPKRLANSRAVARRVAAWTGRGIGAGARRAHATTSRVASGTAGRLADVRENRQVHGRKPVVRDLTLDPAVRRPLSPDQAEAHLLGLEAARASADGRAAHVVSSRVRPVDAETLRRAAAPIRLTWWDRRQLPRDWAPERVHTTQAVVTDHLTDLLTAGPRNTGGGGWGPPSTAVDLDDIQPKPAAPAPGAAVTTKGTTTVIEPSDFTDLANPGIEQATWTEELPAHAQLVVRLAQRPAEGFRALADYHRAAQSREDIVSAYEEAASAAQAVMDQCQQAAQRAEEWANSVRLPDFSRAG